jgi:predicted nucleotidyltransferase
MILIDVHRGKNYDACMTLPPRDTKRLCQFLARFKEVKTVILFGSQATKHATEKSDIDIAVLFAPRKIPTDFELLAMREDLTSLLKKEADLVNMNRANPILKHQIYKKGLVLLDRDKRFSRSFFVQSLVEYDDIRRIRAMIEKKMAKRAIYG